MPYMAWVGRLDTNIRAVLLAFALLLIGLLFRQLATMLVAILITVLIAIPLAACATALERRFRIPRAVGALIGLFVGLGVLAGTLILVLPRFVDEFNVFVDQVPDIVATLQAKLHALSNSSSGSAGTDLQDYLQRFIDHPTDLIGPLASIGLSVAAILGGMILIIVTAFYIAANPDPLLEGTFSLLPPRRREWARRVAERLRVAWIGWMQGVLLDMVVTGVLLYIGLTLIGLDFAVIFAVVSALMVLIPYFGAIVGGILPTLYALTYSPEKALLALGIYVLIQQIEGHITIPLVMAQRVKLHPAVVAIGVVIVGRLFGFLGLFVAVPILSLFVIVVQEVWVRPMEQAPETGVDPHAPEAAADDEDSEDDDDDGDTPVRAGTEVTGAGV